MRRIILIPLLLLIWIGCNREEIDDRKPVIDLSFADAFPVNCDTLYLGETFTWTIRFEDNAELGSYSLEIHHNFDHHAHSTEVEECTLDPVKSPENPLYYLMDFEIPEGTTEYRVEKEISLPLSDGNGMFDPGDYHFFVSLTDREGWSTQKGLSLKILVRD